MIFDTKHLKPPYFIHSDLTRTTHLVRNHRATFNSREELLKAHMSLLKNWLGAENLAFPTFNYDFPKTKLFDLANSPSQVGVLTNYALNDPDFTRTKTPMFSFAVGKGFSNSYSNTPFGEKSVFEEIFQNDGTVILYGPQMVSTFIHYIETGFGPLYRYDKCFSGCLELHLNGRRREDCSVQIHVRPLGIDVIYNWQYLGTQLRDKNALYEIGRNVFAIKTNDMFQIWGKLIERSEPEIFVESPARDKMFSLLCNLKRRFEITDFEEGFE